MLLLSSLLLFASLEISTSVQIGTIRNAWWNQSATSIRNSSVSCDECICAMLMPFSNVIGLNCLLINQTCYLFANYSNDSSTMTSNANSTFYFLVLPSKIISAPSTQLYTSFTTTSRSPTTIPDICLFILGDFDCLSFEFFSFIYSNTIAIKTINGSEDSTISVACPSSQSLQIVNAYYGSPGISGCVMMNVTQFMISYCNNSTNVPNCTFTINNNFFLNDPCSMHLKTLLLNYYCS